MPTGPANDDNDDIPDTAIVDAESRSTPQRSPWAARIAVGLTALVVVLLGVLAFTQNSRISDLEATADRETEIAEVAGGFADALLTYDYRDLDAGADAVAAGATESFAAEYRQAFDAGLGEQITALMATSTATINDVLVSQSTGDTARVIVVADSEVRSDEGNQARVGSYIDLSMVRIDGRWLIDMVSSVANAAPGTGADGGGVEDVAPPTSEPSTETPATESPATTDPAVTTTTVAPAG